MSLVVTVLEYCAGRGVHFAWLVAACAGSRHGERGDDEGRGRGEHGKQA